MVYIMCPHAPEENCTCRKPKPGLLFKAAGDLNINLSASIMIGDALTDIMAGQAAGVGRNMLVLTGRGAEQSKLPRPTDLIPYEFYESLHIAVNHIVVDSSDNETSAK